jgi:hypothetical protein
VEPTRTGKIGRCPPEIREEVNRRLFDGQPASKILPWLNAQESVLRILDEYFNEQPVDAGNLSEWRGGGYQDWLRRRANIETLKELSELSYNVAKGTSPSEFAARIAGGQLCLVLESLDIETQKKLLKEKPASYLMMLDALARVKRSEADAKKAAAAERVVEQNDVRLRQSDRKLLLEESRYQRQTCELFLKWYDDKRAVEILEGKGKKDVKIADLRQLFFGDIPGAEGKA